MRVQCALDTSCLTSLAPSLDPTPRAASGAGGLAPPLFLHVPASSASSDRRLSEGTFEREWEQRVATIFRSQVGAVQVDAGFG